MKIDMHCHVKEGSIDSRVPLEEYIRLLQEKGFGGMVITDHDTYNGYRYWKKNLKGKKYTDFKVFKGIEYDTSGGGHILASGCMIRGFYEDAVDRLVYACKQHMD